MRYPLVILLAALLAFSGNAPAQGKKTRTKKEVTTKAKATTKTKPTATPLKESPTLEAISAMLTDKPTAFGFPITNRAVWDPLAKTAAGRAVIAEAEKILATPMAEQPDELFLEYSKIGNRTNWEGVAFARRARIKWLTEAECLENKGRFLPELEKNIRTLCAEKTWVFPAHDGALTNFNGTLITIDLFSSALAYNMASCDWLLDGKLNPEVRKLIRDNVQRRIVEPYHKMIAGQQDRYWLVNPNNWNAVCLAGTTGAALALIESRQERAFFIKAAMDNSWVFLGGFAPDGYCSEGTGYWNFGFGHYVILSEAIRQATRGGIDLLSRPEAYPPATFGARIQIQNGVCPAFADCTIDAHPDKSLMDFLNRRFSFGLPPYAPEGITAGKGYLFEDLMYLFDQPAVSAKPADKKYEIGLRSWFNEGGVLIGRPAKGAPCRIGVALKGGHNGEHHNHNDLGSYVVVVGDRPVILDPGAETYTKRTFSSQRYDSKLLNSYGHPVPVVAGKLQREGAQYRAKVLKTDFTPKQDKLILDLKSPYLVPDLVTLTRAFVYSRQGAGSLVVTDAVAFTKPETFETALVTFGTWKKTGENTLRVEYRGEAVNIEINTGGKAYDLVSEVIKEEIKGHDKGEDPGLPTRLGIRLKAPVREATIGVKITAAK